jgi:hypothetical protein
MHGTTIERARLGGSEVELVAGESVQLKAVILNIIPKSNKDCVHLQLFPQSECYTVMQIMLVDDPWNRKSKGET